MITNLKMEEGQHHRLRVQWDVDIGIWQVFYISGNKQTINVLIV